MKINCEKLLYLSYFHLFVTSHEFCDIECRPHVNTAGCGLYSDAQFKTPSPALGGAGGEI